MIILSCYNIKGGVGKTSTAVNLAYLASREGARVLLWDLDPQGAASFYYRIRSKVKGGVKSLIGKRSDLDQYIKGTDYPNLDLLPSDFSYRNMDLLLEDTGKPQKRIKKVLEPLCSEYDYIVLDCPPSISLMTEAVFFASDVVLLPTIPTTLSLRTLDQVIKFTKKNNFKKIKLLAFFSMVDRRKNMHRLITENPPNIKLNIMQSTIPYASEVERMGIQREPVNVFAAGSKGSQSFVELWNEVKDCLCT